MAKIFKFLAVFWLTLGSPICAQEADKSREEREKLGEQGPLVQHFLERGPEKGSPLFG